MSTQSSMHRFINEKTLDWIPTPEILSCFHVSNGIISDHMINIIDDCFDAVSDNIVDIAIVIFYVGKNVRLVEKYISGGECGICGDPSEYLSFGIIPTVGVCAGCYNESLTVKITEIRNEFNTDEKFVFGAYGDYLKVIHTIAHRQNYACTYYKKMSKLSAKLCMNIVNSSSADCEICGNASCTKCCKKINEYYIDNYVFAFWVVREVSNEANDGAFYDILRVFGLLLASM